jgi:four helix bundle protein
MPFDHERLDVYQLSLDFLAIADEIIEQLPKGRSYLKNQLCSAALSIVNNVAEGAGKYSKPDKCRFYEIAAGSTTECAALLDVCLRLRFTTEERHRAGKELLDRMMGKLVRLRLNLRQERA